MLFYCKNKDTVAITFDISNKIEKFLIFFLDVVFFLQNSDFIQNHTFLWV